MQIHPEISYPLINAMFIYLSIRICPLVGESEDGLMLAALQIKAIFMVEKLEKEPKENYILFRYILTLFQAERSTEDSQMDVKIGTKTQAGCEEIAKRNDKIKTETLLAIVSRPTKNQIPSL